MAQYRTIPQKNEIFAINSSLAVSVFKDDNNSFNIHIWNRRDNSIIAKYVIPLLEHCRFSLQNVDPIPKLKKRLNK